MSAIDTAGRLCALTALHLPTTGGEVRRGALARSLREIGEVLGDEHTALALRSCWSLGLQAQAEPGQLGPCLGRKATLGELLQLSGGVPRELDYEGARAVCERLIEHYEMAVRHDPDDGRPRAMLGTARRELAAVD